MPDPPTRPNSPGDCRRWRPASTPARPTRSCSPEYVRRPTRPPSAALYDRYAGLVYRVCRRGLPADEADPAFQAVWLVFARKAYTVRDPGAVAGWLARVAVRVTRKARRRAAAAPVPLGDFAPAVPDRGAAADPGRRAELRDLAAAVAREVAALPTTSGWCSSCATWRGWGGPTRSGDWGSARCSSTAGCGRPATGCRPGSGSSGCRSRRR